MQILNNKIDGSGSNANVLPAIEWNQLPSEVQNVITELGITLSNGDLNQLGKAIAGYVANGSFYTDSGVADAYVLTAVGGKQAPPAYTDGSGVEFVTTNPNTGASTVNVAGLGVKNIKYSDGSDPAPGDIDSRTEIKFDAINDWFELDLSETLLWTGWLLGDAFYTGVSKNVNSEDVIPASIFFKPDGLKMYVLGPIDDSVYQYTLAAPWDVSTASYDSVSFNVNSEDTNAASIFFKPDGTKMYMLGGFNDSVYQYTLSTPWDLSTASYDSVSFNNSSEDTFMTGIFFKPDGTKMYVLGFLNDNVYQYTLSTPWDLSTASYDSVSFNVNSEDISPSDVFFKPDGTKMYVLGFISASVYQYTLSTPWDLSTASYDSVSFNVNSEDTFMTGIFFKPDGLKMYVLGDLNDNVYQYSIGRPYKRS